jgi:hypothetical protein
VILPLDRSWCLLTFPKGASGNRFETLLISSGARLPPTVGDSAPLSLRVALATIAHTEDRADQARPCSMRAIVLTIALDPPAQTALQRRRLSVHSGLQVHAHAPCVRAVAARTYPSAAE